MSSTSSRRKHSTELASFHSSFLADDTLVTIVPKFDFGKIKLMSCSAKAGPFKAGIPTHVPLWLALLLQQRSLCTLLVPDWMSVEHLTRVKEYELNHTFLAQSTAASSSSSSSQDDNDNNDDDAPTLPYYYAELGQRFSSTKASSSGNGNGGDASSGASFHKASSLLLADILQIRLDKLRQQFQGIFASQANLVNPSLCLEVPGIASVELAQLKPMILQAMADQRFLATSGAQTVRKQQPRGVRSDGSSSSKMAAGDNDGGNDDGGFSATQDSRPEDTNALRSRIRRFRG